MIGAEVLHVSYSRILRISYTSIVLYRPELPSAVWKQWKTCLVVIVHLQNEALCHLSERYLLDYIMCVT